MFTTTCEVDLRETVCTTAAGAEVHFIFFFNDTAPPEISTLSLHDALPISFARRKVARGAVGHVARVVAARRVEAVGARQLRSEEHTSELQSRQYLVCRLLLEKKKKQPSYSCPYLLHRTSLQLPRLNSVNVT